MTAILLICTVLVPVFVTVNVCHTFWRCRTLPKLMLVGESPTCGPPETDRVKFCPVEPAVLVAWKLMLNVPLDEGVPLNVPVPLPLSWKPTPPGSAPDSLRLAVGYPVVVTVKLPG